MATKRRNKQNSQSKSNPRYAANPLDYRKVIVPRSFDKDWSPKDPRRVLPRMRTVVAFNNNR